MSYFEALLYGFVQGITEYLPISSSAHLILLPKFLNRDDPGLAFDVFLHLGTLSATLIYFWREWRELLRPSQFMAGLKKNEGLSLKLLIVATIPALLLGAALHGFIQDTFRGEGIVVVTLTLGGVLLYLSDRLARGERGTQDVQFKDAMIIGFFQCLALVPGMSRSGSTMSGARILGLDRSSAAKFSFLMSAPVTAAAVLFELRHFDELFQSTIGVGPLLVAGFSSFIFGWLAIDGLLRVLKRVSFLGFALYRVGLSVLVYYVFKPF
jgi:undecaprenyl-diphosphatase